MPNQLPDEMLRGFLEVEAKATKAPWAYCKRNWRNEPEPHDYYVNGDPYTDEDGTRVSVGVCIIKGNATAGEIPKDNAHLIALARNHFRPLIEEIIRLREIERAWKAGKRYIPGPEEKP